MDKSNDKDMTRNMGMDRNIGHGRQAWTGTSGMDIDIDTTIVKVQLLNF